MLYRLRQSIAQRYFQLSTRRLQHTPPLRSDPEASCEVHTMLGTADVTMYTLAVKSLLSYVPNIAVVVHSDGSLTSRDASHIAAHIQGVRFVQHDEADQRAAVKLRDLPFLARWRATDAAYRRLIDIELWRRTQRIIILDADVLTHHEPREVIEWIDHGTAPFLLGQPSKADARQADTRQPEHVQAQFLLHVPQISRHLGLRPLFVQGATAGFCGYFSELSLPRVEAALRAAVDLALPMRQWGGDQCLVIYLLSTAGALRLPPDRYINFEPSIRDEAQDMCMVHFYGTHRFHGLVYPRIAADVVKRLGGSQSYRPPSDASPR
jgi:hypothetical protein